MKEKEILEKIEEIIEYSKLTTDIGIADQTDKTKALEGILNLYNKEKQKNKKLQKELDIKNKIIDKMYDYISYYDWKEFEYNTGHNRYEMFEYFCEEEK